MERLDDVLGYPNLKIYQDSHYFSFSLDSIILANLATIRLRDSKIVDFCTGNGVVPLILSKRCNKVIVGVEIQRELADLAERSVQYNHLEEVVGRFDGAFDGMTYRGKYRFEDGDKEFNFRFTVKK